MKSITVTFTMEEAQVAINLWEAALKAIGGPAATAFVVLSGKLLEAEKALQPPAVAPEKDNTHKTIQ